MANKRFVFLLSKPGHEVLDGSDLEIRAQTQLDADDKVRLIEQQFACTARLIGIREGSKSSARFLPLVAVSELPEHIRQNEAIVTVREVA